VNNALVFDRIIRAIVIQGTGQAVVRLHDQDSIRAKGRDSQPDTVIPGQRGPGAGRFPEVGAVF
jgi:hypothetical protein